MNGSHKGDRNRAGLGDVKNSFFLCFVNRKADNNTSQLLNKV